MSVCKVPWVGLAPAIPEAAQRASLLKICEVESLLLPKSLVATSTPTALCFLFQKKTTQFTSRGLGSALWRRCGGWCGGREHLLSPFSGDIVPSGLESQDLAFHHTLRLWAIQFIFPSLSSLIYKMKIHVPCGIVRTNETTCTKCLAKC